METAAKIIPPITSIKKCQPVASVEKITNAEKINTG